MTGDRITITGLRAFGHHGVFESERTDGQEFVLDVTIWVDFAAASAGDDLEATVHYGVVSEEIVAAVERDPVDLIETLAERVASVVLGHAAASAVQVTVHKPHAPITVPFSDVAVTITRSRA
jgi:7,8-dihydroneopterin aldolase/epimerase/oxygenase